MSDLVERLRDTPNWKREEYGDYKSSRTHYDIAPFEAADRIEELEAKLAKATDALGAIITDGTWGLEHENYMKCRAALAELKGDT